MCRAHRIHLPLETKCYFRTHKYLRNTSKLSLRNRGFVSRRTGAAPGRGGERRSPGTPARDTGAPLGALPGAGHRTSRRPGQRARPPAMGSQRLPSKSPGARLGTERPGRGSQGDRHRTPAAGDGRGLLPRSRRRTVPQNGLNRSPGERRWATERSRENRFHEPPSDPGPPRRRWRER